MAKEFKFNSSDFEKGLSKYSERAQNALLAGLAAAADALLEDSTDIVPFDKGFSGGLASTASKVDPKFSGTTAEVTVGYNKVYAARLHEDMSLKIVQRNTVSGQKRSQKYLENPMKQNAEKYAKIMADTIKSKT